MIERFWSDLFRAKTGLPFLRSKEKEERGKQNKTGKGSTTLDGSGLVVAEFDQIAEVYDETRRPLDEETVNGMKEMLTKHGCKTILEIGVGTGRVAFPLASSGFDVTGVDISRKMMDRAHAKGIENLVLANGSQVPFKDRNFDATIMAHVFHLLEDPMSVLRESARVSKIGVFALVRKGRRWGRWQGFFYGTPETSKPDRIGDGVTDESTSKYFEERRQYFRALAEKYGWRPDFQLHARNWQREQEILESHPPDDLKIVSDIVVSESIKDRISRFERGTYSSMLGMPEEMRKELIREMRANAAEHPDRISQPRNEVYQLAMWKPQKFTSD